MFHGTWRLLSSWAWVIRYKTSATECRYEPRSPQCLESTRCTLRTLRTLRRGTYSWHVTLRPDSFIHCITLPPSSLLPRRTQRGSISITSDNCVLWCSTKPSPTPYILCTACRISNPLAFQFRHHAIRPAPSMQFSCPTWMPRLPLSYFVVSPYVVA